MDGGEVWGEMDGWLSEKVNDGWDTGGLGGWVAGWMRSRFVPTRTSGPGGHRA